MPPGRKPLHNNSGLPSSDVLIAGGGIIGLSLALDLRRRGASVTILERAGALRGASSAAAGMLAAEDPYNPPSLLPLSRYSLSLYPEFLSRITTLSGQPIPFQTSATVQYTQGCSRVLAEHSVSPRQLGSALLAAARAASVRIVEYTTVRSLHFSTSAVEATTSENTTYRAGQFVHATGAWSLHHLANNPVSPRKGQMLRVAMPAKAPLDVVHRAEHVYVVPRTVGPDAGTALIGATVENAGFDLTTDPAQLQHLREQAAALSSDTAFVTGAPLLEAWAGLRPHTPDLLPLLGELREREWMALGHFRNGILLAPATASILAGLLASEKDPIDLRPFLPQRFEIYR